MEKQVFIYRLKEIVGQEYVLSSDMDPASAAMTLPWKKQCPMR
jgi:hypothetical protein